jgi:hypothetical protein
MKGDWNALSQAMRNLYEAKTPRNVSESKRAPPIAANNYRRPILRAKAKGEESSDESEESTEGEVERDSEGVDGDGDACRAPGSASRLGHGSVVSQIHTVVATQSGPQLLFPADTGEHEIDIEIPIERPARLEKNPLKSTDLQDLAFQDYPLYPADHDGSGKWFPKTSLGKGGYGQAILWVKTKTDHEIIDVRILFVYRMILLMLA